MSGMEQFPVNEMLPRPARAASQPAVPPRDRRETAPGADDQAAMSFSHLLVARQSRPERASEASADRGGASDQTTAPADKPAPQALSAPPAEAAGGKVETAIAALPSLAGPAGWSGAGASTGASTGVQADATEALPAAAVTSATVETDPDGAIPATAVPDKLAAGDLPTEAPKQAAAPAAAGPKTAPPAAQAAVKEAPLPAAAASVDGNGRPASVPAPASAAALDSAAKAQESYGKAPVVSEAQLLADSLKQEGAPAGSRISTIPGAPTLDGQGARAVSPASAAAPGSFNLTGEPGFAVAGGPAEAAPAATDRESEAAEAATEKMADSVPDEGAVPLDPATGAVATAGTESAESTETATPAAAPAPDTGDTAADAAPGAALDPAAVRVQDSAAQKSTAGAAGQTGVSRQVHRQVISLFASRLTNITGGEQVTIKLNPESLGQIELNFEAQEDRLSVVITASTTEADTAVRESLKDLTDRIVERSARFSHVDVRVEVRDGNETRQDGKSDQKQEGRQDQRRGQNGQEHSEGQNGQERQRGHQARAAQQSWENAMSWQLADEAASEEG